MEYPHITRSLITLKEKDLALRDQLIERGELEGGYHPEMAALHRENAEALEHIMASIGYPTEDKVGKAGSAAAWLIIQHAIGCPDFMKNAARQLSLAVDQRQANPIHLAYLTDRIAVFQDQPQRYGTQFDWDDKGEMQPQPFDDLQLVNERRAALGLNSLEEQIKVMQENAAAEGATPPADLAQRKKLYQAWRRSVGWL